MGDVYAAHDPELDRKVAIKLLRGASDGSPESNDSRARLIREAQAIAKVSHPNVVTVYDVGTFEGRVFIAMEFVDGHTLRYWLLAARRTTAQIMEVFGAAGRGLAAAHEKELVHRDFKPDNVMVTAADGQVRVMDFGLACLAIDPDLAPQNDPVPRSPLLTIPDHVDPDLNSTHLLSSPPAADTSTRLTATSTRLTATTTREPLWNLTVAGAILGTPAYMSPEQFLGRATDARTDQFSFCVALYEALYGERPFRATSIGDLSAEVIAGNVRATPPSARVPESTRRALLRGLSASPDARFPSMNALLAVLGQEQTLSGVRRFAAGAMVKLAGVWEAADAEGPLETDAKMDIRRAFLATDKPYAAASFELVRRTLDRFARRWTDLYVEACEATHVRGEQSTEVLDLRMTALGEALEDLRALCREFRRSTADTIENAVNAANALGSLERCADVKLLRAIVRPPNDPAMHAAVEQLHVRLSEVRALGRVGRVADGLKAAIALEADARRLGYAPLLAEVLFMSGMMRFEVSAIEEATSTLEDAVWTAELCRHDEVAAEAAANLVFITGHQQGRFDAGEIWSRHAETVLARMGGHEQIRGWLYNNRGAMRASQGRLQDAIADNHLAIAEKQKALGPDDPDVGLSIGNAALYLDQMGDTAQAAEYAERAVKLIGAALGADHPKTAMELANHAEMLNRLGRFQEAQQPARQALAVFERETDPQGLYVSYPLTALGGSLIGLARFDEAIPLLERAMSIRDARADVLAKRAEVRFALARALWGGGRARDRALDLATRARSEYLDTAATPATERELADIARWLEVCSAAGASLGPAPGGARPV